MFLNPEPSLFAKQGLGKPRDTQGLEGAQESHRAGDPTLGQGQSHPRPSRQELREAGPPAQGWGHQRSSIAGGTGLPEVTRH